MDIDINFIKNFYDKFNNISIEQINNFVTKNYSHLKKKNFLFNKKQFHEKYINFDINYYYIFNDAMKNLNEFQIINNWHNKEKKNKYIYNLDTFYKKYNNYDKKIFISLNQDSIQKYKIIYNDLLIDFYKNKLTDEIYYMKLYDLFKSNGINIKTNILTFLKENPKINLKNIILFNQKELNIDENNISLEDKKNIIFFYFENINKKDIILRIEDFKEKYTTFNIQIFKKFNKQYKNLDEIFCISKYLNENLIGSIYDFLKKYPNYNIQKLNQNLNKEQIIDILVSYYLRNQNNIHIKEKNNKLNLQEINNELITQNKIKISKELNDISKELNDNSKESNDNSKELNDNSKESNDNSKESNDNSKESNDNSKESNDNSKEYNIHSEISYINNISNFDWLFYISSYEDLKHMNKKEATEHYFKHGINENRLPNLEMLKKKYEKNNKFLDIEKINFKTSNKKENKFNILIRHCYRPKVLKKCIDSIFNQIYNNIQIYLCYDNKLSEEYLNFLNQYKNIDFFYINIESSDKYKYELYCNELLNKVTDGWVIFLDDDDMFLNENSLKLINEKIENDNDLILWQYLRSDKVIFPKDINNIKCGDITSCGYTFHSKFKDLSKWNSQHSGDYNFFKGLIEKIRFEKKVLSKLIIGNINVNKISGNGEEEKNKFKLISIIIPYYNNKNIFKLVLDRFYDLYENENIELIILDLNSNTKNSLFDILKYDKFKIKLIKVNKLEGFLNLAIQNIDVKSELIIFQHQDIYHSKNIFDLNLDYKKNCFSLPVFLSPSDKDNDKYFDFLDKENNISKFIDEINFEEYNFDYNFYISKYKDAQNLSYNEAYKHYLKYSNLRMCNEKNILIESKIINDNNGWVSHYKYNTNNINSLLVMPSKILNDFIILKNDINTNNDFFNLIKQNNNIIHLDNNKLNLDNNKVNLDNNINIKLSSSLPLDYFKISFLHNNNFSLNKISFGDIEYFINQLKINTFIINLEFRKDRKEKIIKRLNNIKSKKYLFDYKIIKAVHHKEFGAIGCGKSHIECLMKAKKLNLPFCIIMEDDIILKHDLIEKYLDIIFEKYNDFDVFLLSSRGDKKKCDDYTSECVKCYAAGMYFIKNSYYDKLIENFTEAVLKMEEYVRKYNNPVTLENAIDVKWHKLQEKDKWLIFNINLGYQEPGYSDIEKKEVDYLSELN